MFLDLGYLSGKPSGDPPWLISHRWQKDGSVEVSLRPESSQFYFVFLLGAYPDSIVSDRPR
jgi:hypothetical protein